MLKGRLNNGTFLLGLDAENIKRLMAGQPIVLSLADIGGKDDIMIMYGATIDDIKRELIAASGKPLPEPTTVTRH